MTLNLLSGIRSLKSLGLSNEVKDILALIIKTPNELNYIHLPNCSDSAALTLRDKLGFSVRFVAGSNTREISW